MQYCLAKLKHLDLGNIDQQIWINKIDPKHTPALPETKYSRDDQGSIYSLKVQSRPIYALNTFMNTPIGQLAKSGFNTKVPTANRLDDDDPPKFSVIGESTDTEYNDIMGTTRYKQSTHGRNTKRMHTVSVDSSALTETHHQSQFKKSH